MTPKSLLRHPMAISNFEEMGPGTSFMHVLPDLSVKPGNVKKVLLCTGKVYYDLIVERQERQLEDKIAIIRIEQLCPFPYHLFAAEMTKYPRAKVRSFRLTYLLMFNSKSTQVMQNFQIAILRNFFFETYLTNRSEFKFYVLRAFLIF